MRDVFSVIVVDIQGAGEGRSGSFVRKAARLEASLSKASTFWFLLVKFIVLPTLLFDSELML